MKITKQALLDRGFKEYQGCVVDGESYEDYMLKKESFKIIAEFRGDEVKHIQAFAKGSISVPNCRTLKQLDALIDLFKE